MPHKPTPPGPGYPRKSCSRVWLLSGARGNHDSRESAPSRPFAVTRSRMLPSADGSGLSRAILHRAAFQDRHLTRTVVHDLKGALGRLRSTVIDLCPRAADPFPRFPGRVGLSEEDGDVAV
jgi:hypothetical protein